MNSDERAILHRCLNKTKGLFERRTRSEDWSHNLIEGSRGLTTATQWKHFYVWLANPNQYNEDAVEKLEIDNSLTKIEEYADCMEVHTFQNGPCEQIIHVKNPAFYTNEDEKIEE